MQYNFGRVIKVIAYSVNQGETTTITGDAKYNSPKILIDTVISKEDILSTCKMTIYNIRQDTHTQITQAQKVEIYAYYSNESESLLFTGTVSNSSKKVKAETESTFDIIGNLSVAQREMSFEGNNINLSRGHTLLDRINLFQSTITQQLKSELKLDKSYETVFTTKELTQTFNALTLPNDSRYTRFTERLFRNTIVASFVENETVFLYRKDNSFISTKEYYTLKCGTGGNVVALEHFTDEIRKPSYDNLFKKKQKRNANINVVSGFPEQQTEIQQKVPTITIRAIFNANAGFSLNRLYKLENAQNLFEVNQLYKQYFEQISNLNGFWKAISLRYNLDTKDASDGWNVELKLINEKV